VILLDANLLVYAHVAGMPRHQAVRLWLDQKLSGRERVGMPWLSLLAFVRLVSNPRVFERPEAVPAAWSQAEEWLCSAPAMATSPASRAFAGRTRWPELDSPP
jgi:predicted nucleic acid-binding protein